MNDKYTTIPVKITLISALLDKTSIELESSTLLISKTITKNTDKTEIAAKDIPVVIKKVFKTLFSFFL